MRCWQVAAVTGTPSADFTFGLYKDLDFATLRQADLVATGAPRIRRETDGALALSAVVTGNPGNQKLRVTFPAPNCTNSDTYTFGIWDPAIREKSGGWNVPVAYGF